MTDKLVDPKSTLDNYSECQTTVWFYESPTGSVEVKWQAHTVYSSLRNAIEAICVDTKYHAYDVIVHGDRDISLTSAEVDALCAYIRSEGA